MLRPAGRLVAAVVHTTSTRGNYSRNPPRKWGRWSSDYDKPGVTRRFVAPCPRARRPPPVDVASLPRVVAPATSGGCPPLYTPISDKVHLAADELGQGTVVR